MYPISITKVNRPASCNVCGAMNTSVNSDKFKGRTVPVVFNLAIGWEWNHLCPECLKSLANQLNSTIEKLNI